MKGTVTVFTKKPVSAIDYIVFGLKNGDEGSAVTDHEVSYMDEGSVNGKRYPCLVMEGCNIDLGNIPFLNQISRIKGIKEIQTYDEEKQEEQINKVKIVGIMFEQDGERAALSADCLKYIV